MALLYLACCSYYEDAKKYLNMALRECDKFDDRNLWNKVKNEIYKRAEKLEEIKPVDGEKLYVKKFEMDEEDEEAVKKEEEDTKPVEAEYLEEDKDMDDEDVKQDEVSSPFFFSLTMRPRTHN